MCHGLGHCRAITPGDDDSLNIIFLVRLAMVSSRRGSSTLQTGIPAEAVLEGSLKTFLHGSGYILWVRSKDVNICGGAGLYGNLIRLSLESY